MTFMTFEIVPSPTPAQTVFLLSPARLDGRRAAILLREEAAFPLALRLRDEGISLGEAFSFMSGLYFRGKLAYARGFGRARDDGAGALVIVPGLGLVSPDHVVRVADLLEIGRVGVNAEEPRFREPLDRDARALAARCRDGDQVVLLGSIASTKYTEILSACLGEWLRFPVAFVGRGDMSRGGLLLRCVTSGEALEYVALAGAKLRGPRPPRLERAR